MQVTEEMSWWLQPMHKQRVAAMDLSPVMLRVKIITSVHSEPSLTLESPSDCERIAATVHPSISKAAVYFLDGGVLFNHDYEQVVFYDTLQCLHSRILDIATCDQVASVKSPFAQVLSKVIPQRCMTRMMYNVCKALFLVSRALPGRLRQVLLCSLLGNFPHSRPSSRPSLPTRRVLYQLLHFRLSDKHAGTQWFLRLFKNCTHVMEFALRDYLVAEVEDNPSMRAHMEMLFDWNAFRTCVEDAMGRIRLYLDFSMQLRHSPFKDSLPPHVCLARLNRTGRGYLAHRRELVGDPST